MSLPEEQSKMHTSTHHYSDHWMAEHGNKNLVQSLRDMDYGPDIPLVHRVIEIFTDKVEVTEYFEPQIELKKIGIHLRTEAEVVRCPTKE